MNITTPKLAVGTIALVIAAAAAWLAFGFFGVHTAFIDNKVNDAGPVFTPTAEPAVTPSANQSDSEAADQSSNQSDPGAAATEPAGTAGDAEVAAPAPAPEAPVENEVVTIYDGQFEGVSRYSVSGDALVLNNGTEQRFLRFENFNSSNGPDLKVYLRADNGDFVNLGNLRGNVGDQNYEIPPDVDLSVFNTVDIWCERFSVGFGVASLAAT
jgi:hypothetical protein